MEIVNFIGSYYGGLITLFLLHRLIDGKWPKMKWDYFIPIWGIILFISDTL